MLAGLKTAGFATPKAQNPLWFCRFGTLKCPECCLGSCTHIVLNLPLHENKCYLLIGYRTDKRLQYYQSALSPCPKNTCQQELLQTQRWQTATTRIVHFLCKLCREGCTQVLIQRVLSISKADNPLVRIITAQHICQDIRERRSCSLLALLFRITCCQCCAQLFIHTYSQGVRAATGGSQLQTSCPHNRRPIVLSWLVWS